MTPSPQACAPGEGRRPRRILLSNAYSWKNKGDAAIVLVMLAQIRAQFPEAVVTVSSSDREDAGRYGSDCGHTASFLTVFKETCGTPSTVPERISFGLRFLLFRAGFALFSALGVVGVRAYAIFPRAIASKIQEYREYDLVLACGGGYLLTPVRHRKVETLFGCYDSLIFSYDFRIASLFGLRYVLCNQSVGPFARHYDARLFLPALRGARAIVCREPLTFERLAGLGLGNLRLGYDFAFDLPAAAPAGLDDVARRSGEHAVGLTVRSWLPRSAQERYEAEIARFVELVLAGNGAARIYFMPQVIHASGNDDDRRTALRILGRVDGNLAGRVRVVEEDLHPSELKHLIGRMTCFIGTRMHSNIFSLSSGVRTVAIAYEPKGLGIMQWLGLERYCLAMGELEAETLFARYREVLVDERYLPALAEGLARMKAHGPVDLRELLGP